MASVKDPQVTTLKTLEAALKLVDTKKESLKKAYDELQSHSSLLSSSLSSMSWSDLDSHFSALQNDLTRRFQLLQSLESSPNNPPPTHDRVDDSVANRIEVGSSDQAPPGYGENLSSSSGHSGSVHNPSSSCKRPREDRIEPDGMPSELMSLCEKMDGKGLRDYINGRERSGNRVDLVGAMRVASDPGAMVLDALEGFYPTIPIAKGDRETELVHKRKSCLELLEALVKIKPVVSNEVRERAKKLALEWKGKMNMKGERTSEPLGFLNLVVAYQLQNEFDSGELVGYFFAVSRLKQAPSLCGAMNLGDRTADLIQRLINNGKRLLAVNFIFECGMAEKFQPVSLLKAHLKECREIADKASNDGKSSIKQQIEAVSREINALRSVIQIINEHKLDSEYPRADLEKQVEMLEKQKSSMKVSTPSSDNMARQQQKQQSKQPKKQQPQQQQPKKQQPQQQQPRQQPKKQKLKHNQQQTANKRARTAGPSGPAEVPFSVTSSSFMIPSFQQSHSQPAAGPYGLVGSTPPVAPYASASVGHYGLAGPAVSYYGNPNPTPVAHPYTQEPYAPSGYYDGPTGYNGYGMPPQYHPTYYPQ